MLVLIDWIEYMKRNMRPGQKTILKNGGVYESTVHEPDEDIDLQRYWIEI